jgi:hypothetical protein
MNEPKPIIDQFIINSKCATDPDERKHLKKLLGGKKQLVATLLYRGSEHGWKLKDFHQRCDNKGSTILLCRIKDGGDCIGGFTNA